MSGKKQKSHWVIQPAEEMVSSPDTKLASALGNDRGEEDIHNGEVAQEEVHGGVGAGEGQHHGDDEQVSQEHHQERGQQEHQEQQLHPPTERKSQQDKLHHHGTLFSMGHPPSSYL